MLSDRLDRPVCVCCDYSYPCTVRLINKSVRATFVVYYYDLELGSWQPLQRRSHVARPNAPPGSVFELDDMTLLVPCNQHMAAASGKNNSIAPEDTGPAPASAPHSPSRSHLSSVHAPPRHSGPACTRRRAARRRPLGQLNRAPADRGRPHTAVRQLRATTSSECGFTRLGRPSGGPG